MYKTLQEIKDKINQQFDGVDYLGVAIESDMATYSHNSKSGVGCAIGCLLPAELANKLQDISFNNDLYFLTTIYTAYEHSTVDDESLAVLKEVFSYFDFTAYSVNELAQFQRMHDHYVDAFGPQAVKQFLLELNDGAITVDPCLL